MRTFLITLLGCLATSLGCLRSSVSAGESIPDAQLQFLRQNCLDCHDNATQEMGIDLEVSEVAWSEKGSLGLWERVLIALESGQMPPEDSGEIDADEREAMVVWLRQRLADNTPIGGTLARRLNQTEYQATIKALFGLKEFSLPPGFPADREVHGFDNVGEGLVLSPPLLQAYAETARQVADRIFPPSRKTPDPVSASIGAGDLVISYSCGKVIDDAFRLGMKCDPIQRSCTWPSRFEADVSGTYSFTVHLSSFRPRLDSDVMRVKILARDVASKDSVTHNSLRVLQEIEVTSESPQAFRFDADLYAGQTPVVHWANAPLDSDRGDKADLKAFFEAKEEEQPGYLAAWHAMTSKESGQGFRGGIGWERVKTLLDRGEVAAISEKEKEAFLKKVQGNPVLYAETVVFDVLENGPALEVHGLSIEGPKRLVEGPDEIDRARMQARFLGDDPDPAPAIGRFLKKAFRRDVDVQTVDTYVRLYEQHLASGHSTEEAMHLVIRSVLVSPRFLYRCLDEGALDADDLATRLAYFLTGAPPDEKLAAKADSEKLLEADVLRREAERLMPKRATDATIVNFTEQWLDTRKLVDIMPDQKFGFSASDQQNAKLEVEHFFSEMLRENRPMTDFIDPDFTWTSARVAKNVYQLKKGFDAKKKNAVHRIEMPRGGRHGGLLGQAAVMMATANGVDTQPVLRGVWVLENILGTPPPPPPKAVPPITPDTQGAKTPRELLSAHTAEASCAACHRKIDPVGFILESFDPVGRWREEWPEIEVPIDTATTLPDGTEIKDIVEFKAWLVDHIDQFSQCLAEKLMTYATGRLPNYSERIELGQIVEANREKGNGFRDLVLALIQSETFRTK